LDDSVALECGKRRLRQAKKLLSVNKKKHKKLFVFSPGIFGTARSGAGSSAPMAEHRLNQAPQNGSTKKFLLPLAFVFAKRTWAVTEYQERIPT